MFLIEEPKLGINEIKINVKLMKINEAGIRSAVNVGLYHLKFRNL